MQEKKVKAAAAYGMISLRKIAEELNTSPQNLSNRLKRGSLKRADMERIAEILGAEYVLEEYFIFPDGTKI